MMEGTMFGNTMGAGYWLWMLVMAVVMVVPIWRICQRAGYPGWIGILILVHMVNLALLYFLAFARWPANTAGDRHD